MGTICNSFKPVRYPIFPLRPYPRAPLDSPIPYLDWRGIPQARLHESKVAHEEGVGGIRPALATRHQPAIDRPIGTLFKPHCLQSPAQIDIGMALTTTATIEFQQYPTQCWSSQGLSSAVQDLAFVTFHVDLEQNWNTASQRIIQCGHENRFSRHRIHRRIGHDTIDGIAIAGQRQRAYSCPQALRCGSTWAETS